MLADSATSCSDDASDAAESYAVRSAIDYRIYKFNVQKQNQSFLKSATHLSLRDMAELVVQQSSRRSLERMRPHKSEATNERSSFVKKDDLNGRIREGI